MRQKKSVGRAQLLKPGSEIVIVNDRQIKRWEAFRRRRAD